ncbi:MAG: phosphoglucosamine mutase [Rickettsiales bacterium]|nr:phosphoglucosamine mutase [Rickettsiales bacterium]
MTKLFGTDGIRGLANSSPMTAELALKVGMAAGHAFNRGKHRHRVVIAKDTRLSGYMVENALTAGFLSVGMHVYLVGPLPTPGVGMLTRSMRADLGVMISASHNPYHDNGIKLFGPDGEKLSDDIQQQIEDLIAGDLTACLAEPERIGRARRIDDAKGRYIEFVKATFPKELTLKGLKIVIDCANGAGYEVGPTILWELGAEVIQMGVDPDGFNVNEACGSTHPEALCARVITEGADLGIALDGDADRVIMCDEKGQLIDGDHLMAMIAARWHQTGELQGGGIVSTQMANLGLTNYLKRLGLELHRAKVGDRYVVEMMKEKGCNLGGEPSGHVILSDYSTTGDALIAALQVLALMLTDGRSLSKASRLFDPVPQVLVNVRYASGEPLEDANVKDAIANAESTLGEKGRVFIRKSGTEPLIRVMIEGESESRIRELANGIAEAVSATQKPKLATG